MRPCSRTSSASSQREAHRATRVDDDRVAHVDGRAGDTDRDVDCRNPRLPRGTHRVLRERPDGKRSVALLRDVSNRAGHEHRDRPGALGCAAEDLTPDRSDDGLGPGGDDDLTGEVLVEEGVELVERAAVARVGRREQHGPRRARHGERPSACVAQRWAEHAARSPDEEHVGERQGGGNLWNGSRR